MQRCDQQLDLPPGAPGHCTPRKGDQGWYSAHKSEKNVLKLLEQVSREMAQDSPPHSHTAYTSRGSVPFDKISSRSAEETK